MSTTTDPAATAAHASLPAATRLGTVHLTVRDLERSVDFYREAIGLAELRREDRTAWVGAGDRAMLALHEDPSAADPGRTAGLYHVALNTLDRLELARLTRRLAETRTPIQGASDHGTHEAIYLPDPDGNGLELAADREREVWPDLTKVEEIRPRPLDLDALLQLTAGESLVELTAPGARVGHLHLHLGDLDRGLAFHRDLLGFDLQTLIPGQAAFVSAGGYHHHLAFNLWKGAGVPPQPEGRVGLRHWTVVVPTADDVAEVCGRLVAAGAPTSDVEGGFRAQDPGALAVHVVAEGGDR
ncbi:VOC family protein [Patulibacter minatonensis]|uniref:VOC family protein n=1 Tax=Patulibacter minatonensis TaxID=298163 RepID=UPI000686ECED|nr:VOC family protein [Patulibacter minatonensis]